MNRYGQNTRPVLRAARLALAIAFGAACLPALAQDAGERYAKLRADAESYTRYNAFLEKQIAAQQGRLADVEAQAAQLDATAAALGGQLDRMFAELERFVAADIPFADPIGGSADSRKDRMERLREMMANAEVSQAEKYRRLLEAYQIEIEYGRSVAAYSGQLPDGRKADYVRVGRVALLYRTSDGEESGYWDRNQKQWVIDEDFGPAVLIALRVARKELAPDVIQVPVPAPQEVGS